MRSVEFWQGYPLRQHRKPASITFGELEAETIMTPSGPAWSLRIDIERPDALPEDAELWLWLRDRDEDFIAAGSDKWADAEGNACIHAQLEEDDDGQLAFVATVPFVAVPSLCPRRVELYGEVQNENDELIEEVAWELYLPSRVDREEGHLLGAFVGAAVDTVGKLEKAHRRRIESFLADAWQLDEDGVQVLRQVLARRLEGRWNTMAWEASFAELDEDERKLLASFLLQVMMAGGGPTDEQEQDVEALFEAFGIGVEVWRECRDTGDEKREEKRREEQKHEEKKREEQKQEEKKKPAVSIDASFAVLELDAKADWVAVRRAYLKLASDYHPDKVATLPEGFRKYATERTQQIIAAHEQLKKHFGR